MVQALSIRTKLIIAMLALMASVALMGVTARDAHAAVTEMRTIYNNTSQTYYVKNHENNQQESLAPISRPPVEAELRTVQEGSQLPGVLLPVAP
jgi:hypothetical protein